MPPIEATEKNPAHVCSDPSAGARSWIAVWVETDNNRDCGAGSVAVWNGASAQVQLVETSVAAPISAVKSKAKLSISPISIGSNGVARRIAGFLIASKRVVTAGNCRDRLLATALEWVAGTSPGHGKAFGNSERLC